MTRIDIFSGFLGAGKTTLIRKLIAEAYKGEKLVLIENEFGEIAIDGGFLRDAGVEITEMNSGCICCTLVGDFEKALKKVMDEYKPDRIIIEPSGVGKLSDVARAVEKVEGTSIGAKVTVVDAGKCRMYMRNFGEFFNDQVANADLIVMSRTDTAPESKILAASELLRKLNPTAGLITTPWAKLNGMQIKDAMDGDALKKEMEHMEHEAHEHHHHHDDDDDECTCGCHDHDHEHEEHEHHHHHDDDEECGCGHHHHHHDDDDDEDEHEHHHHDGECGCGHHHHHHHDHDADEVFTSWGLETNRTITKEKLESLLQELAHSEKYGQVLRAKGMLPDADGTWYYFDLVPEETEVRTGAPIYTGKVCVIGSNLKEDELKKAFEA